MQRQEKSKLLYKTTTTITDDENDNHNHNDDDNKPLLIINETTNDQHIKDYHHLDDLSIDVKSSSPQSSPQSSPTLQSIKLTNSNNSNNNQCNLKHHKYYHIKNNKQQQQQQLQQLQQQQQQQIINSDDCCSNIELFIDLMLTENEFILSGFRIHTKNSFTECFKSIFKLHNDTLNIWTHLIGAIFYLILFFNSISNLISNSSNDDGNNDGKIKLNKDEIKMLSTIELPSNFNLLFFQFSCFLCFFSSSIYHTFRSHSLLVFKRTLMMDVSSIGFLILSSVCLIIDSELSCWPTFKKYYQSSFLLLIFITSLILPRIMREKRYGLRTFLFSILALQGLVSHLFKIYLRGGYFDQNPYQLYCLIGAYLFFALGLSIRRFKVPEFFSPGSFDIFFSSHQLFHVLVVFGTIQIINAYSYIYLNEFNNINYVKQCMGI